jgi:RNA polymerase sigma factor (sigma-70 family)
MVPLDAQVQPNPRAQGPSEPAGARRSHEMASSRVSSPVRLPPFQALLDAHGRDVHRFLIASVGPLDAEDCYQETWLSALRAYPDLRDASNLRSWLLTIAHRKAIDHVRSRARRPVPVPEPAADAVDGAQPATGLDDGVWSSVAQLPNKQRTALALRFVADAKYAEIASVMETSEEAARRNVHEGLKRLRKEYTP